MQWNCPHCSTRLALAEDQMENGWSFSKCPSCPGHALIRKTGINVIRVDKAPPGEKLIIPKIAAPSSEIPSSSQTNGSGDSAKPHLEPRPQLVLPASSAQKRTLPITEGKPQTVVNPQHEESSRSVNPSTHANSATSSPTSRNSQPHFSQSLNPLADNRLSKAEHSSHFVDSKIESTLSRSPMLPTEDLEGIRKKGLSDKESPFPSALPEPNPDAHRLDFFSKRTMLAAVFACACVAFVYHQFNALISQSPSISEGEPPALAKIFLKQKEPLTSPQITQSPRNSETEVKNEDDQEHPTRVSQIESEVSEQTGTPPLIAKKHRISESSPGDHSASLLNEDLALDSRADVSKTSPVGNAIEPSAQALIRDQIQRTATAPDPMPPASGTKKMDSKASRRLIIELRGAMKGGKASLYSGPGTEYPVISTITSDQRYEVIDWKEKWVKLQNIQPQEENSRNTTGSLASKTTSLPSSTKAYQALEKNRQGGWERIHPNMSYPQVRGWIRKDFVSVVSSSNRIASPN